MNVAVVIRSFSFPGKTSMTREEMLNDLRLSNGSEPASVEASHWSVAEIERLQKDAARYRWLRVNDIRRADYDTYYSNSSGYLVDFYTAQKLDQAIDELMAQQKIEENANESR